MQYFWFEGWFQYGCQPLLSEGLCAIIPLQGGVVYVVSRACAGCEVGLPLCSVSLPCQGWGPLPVGVKALRVGFDQTLLPLSACLAPEVMAEAGAACVVTEALCAACVGFHSSAQKQPKAASLSLFIWPRSSVRLW